MSETHGTFEHGADFGIWGRGPGVTEAFCETAKAMFALVTDLAAVKPQVTVYFDFEESDVEMALVRWLNLLLFHAADQGIVLEDTALGTTWRRA